MLIDVKSLRFAEVLPVRRIGMQAARRMLRPETETLLLERFGQGCDEVGEEDAIGTRRASTNSSMSAAVDRKAPAPSIAPKRHESQDQVPAADASRGDPHSDLVRASSCSGSSSIRRFLGAWQTTPRVIFS